MRSRTELAWEIRLTDWSMAGNLSNWSSGVQIPRDICTRLKRCLYSEKWIYEKSYIWTTENDMKIWLVIAVMLTTQVVVKLKPEKNSDLKGIRYWCYAFMNFIRTSTIHILFKVKWVINMDMNIDWSEENRLSMLFDLQTLCGQVSQVLKSFFIEQISYFWFQPFLVFKNFP